MITHPCWALHLFWWLPDALAPSESRSSPPRRKSGPVINRRRSPRSRPVIAIFRVQMLRHAAGPLLARRTLTLIPHRESLTLPDRLDPRPVVVPQSPTRPFCPDLGRLDAVGILPGRAGACHDRSGVLPTIDVLDDGAGMTTPGFEMCRGGFSCSGPVGFPWIRNAERPPDQSLSQRTHQRK